MRSISFETPTEKLAFQGMQWSESMIEGKRLYFLDSDLDFNDEINEEFLRDLNEFEERET